MSQIWQQINYVYRDVISMENYHRVLKNEIQDNIESLKPKKYFFTHYGDHTRLRLKINKDLNIKTFIDRSRVNELIQDIEIDDYDPDNDIGNRYCRRENEGDIDEKALNYFIDYWYSASKYFLQMLNDDGSIPRFPNFGFAPHLFYNLMGTTIPIDEYQLNNLAQNGWSKSEVEKWHKKGYFTEIVAITQKLDEGYSLPLVIGGTFPGYYIVPRELLKLNNDI